MKKILIVLLALLCVAGLAFAADSPAPASDQPAKIAISFNPLGLLIFSFPVSGEYALTKDISVVADVFYSPNIVWITDISVLDVTAGARYYFGDKIGGSVPDWVKGPALRGLFAGARIGYVNETWDYSSYLSGYKGSYSSFGFGAEAGLKYFFKKATGFYAEGNLGFMYYLPATWTWTYNGVTESVATYSAGWDSTGLTYGVKIGYAF
jgi:hypothetical protein